MSRPAQCKDHAVDTECYRDYWLCKIDGVGEWQMFPGHPLDVQGLRAALSSIRSITFNGINYDFPIMALALTGADNITLKAASDEIIGMNLKGWQFLRKYNLQVPPFAHIDIMQVLPGRNSLKLYGAKNHSRKLQDLPFDPSASIGPVERWKLRTYCQNDLDTTRELYEKFSDRFELRDTISRAYSIDVRSKSDPQIAETVMKQDLGVKINIPQYQTGHRFTYRKPDWIDFDVKFEPFVLTDTGKIEFGNISPVIIGGMSYRMGIGGLHSTEARVTYRSTDDMVIADHDVASYYPSLILNCGVSPVQLGGEFPRRYREWYERRLEAKREKRTSESESLKTFLNGTFGKLGEKFSIFYSPEDLIQVTLTGQLALLMLIRDLDKFNIRVVSANTDGIVVYCARKMIWLKDQIIKAWETRTGLTMEETRYKSIHSRDVNSYIAIKEDGTVKLKGDYAPPTPVGTSWPSPTTQVCVNAVIEHILTGIDTDTYIRLERDARLFLFAQKVSGGAVWRGEYLGRVARWYWSTDGDTINYATNGNKVGLSDGARPMMELEDDIPDDVDMDRYIARAHDILKEIGYGTY